MSEFRYQAFISYSWTDAKWGKWIQQAIETYRTPKALIGEEKRHGKVPARLHPLFKDREEEAAGSSIGAAVEAALADSAFLVVVCSPNSAKSEWVNREIAWFKTHRDPDRVLALIVDGEPGSADAECFPKALTHKVAPDLTITDEPQDAPLAADARESGDGKRMAKLKIAAAMLGVGLDELVRRDERRRTVRNRIVVTASLALAAVMSTLTWFAVEARNEAEFQRNEADGLVEFMLTDLRDKLEPVGRLDALDVVGERALEYYAAQKLGDLDGDALGRRARALLLVGEISNIRGDSEEALKAFTEAAATTQEQLARDPGNAQRVFDHAQSVFWVGYIAYNRGELENTEAQWREYKRLADRLVELDPNKPEWQMESSYAESNLGVMYNEQGRYEEAEPAFARALERIEAVAASEEFDPGRQAEVGMSVNWLGIVTSRLGKDRESLALHEREVAIYDELMERDPANAQAKNRLAIALQYIGQLQFGLGNTAAAIEAFDRSLALNNELQELEPGNTEWQETEVHGRMSQARQLLLLGRHAESRGMLEAARRQLSRMIATDPENETWSSELRVKEARISAELALAEGDLSSARRHVERMLETVEMPGSVLEKDLIAVSHLVEGDFDARSGNANEAKSAWTKALKILPRDAGSDVTRFILLKRIGGAEEAERLAAELDRRGVRHPAYLAAR